MRFYNDDVVGITEAWWSAVVEPNLPEFSRWGGIKLTFSAKGGVIMITAGDQGDDVPPASSSHYLYLNDRGDVRQLVRFLFEIDLPRTPFELYDNP